MKKYCLSLLMAYIIILIPVSFVESITINHDPNTDITISGNTAIIRFNTDEKGNSIVKWGPDPNNQSFSSIIAAQTLDHTVQLLHLVTGRKYYYVLESGNDQNSTRADNNGRFYSFVAGSASSQTKFIDVDIPRYINKESITITGLTFANSEVMLYIDGKLQGQLSKSITGPEGRILFQDRYLGKSGTSHKIKITAKTDSGDYKEAEFDITVDTVPPEVTLDPIQSPITSKNITITGKISEEVNATFYILKGYDDYAPAKINGLTNKSITSDSIEIQWISSKDNDFDKYIIYRDDVGTIATVKPVSNTKYLDVNVNSSTTYTYRVSGVDLSNNEGEKSDPIILKTLFGSKTADTPNAINFTSSNARVEESVFNGPFSYRLEFKDGDGSYNIKIVFSDYAGNNVIFERNVKVDTLPPKIDNIDPKNGANLYENYADQLDITGYTEPFARVYLWVGESPFGSLEDNIQTGGVVGISGYPNDVLPSTLSDPDALLNNIEEAKLHVDCSCDEAADYESIADKNGFFKIKNVDLTHVFSGALSINEQTPREFSTTGYTTDPYLSPANPIRSRVPLMFVAVDSVGLKGKKEISYNLQTCWSGNFTWDIRNLQEYQSPTMLSVERIADGTERLFFYLNFSYLGTTDLESALITSVSVRKACDDYIRRDKRFNISCDIIEGCQTRRVEDNPYLFYVSCQLKQQKDMARWTKNEWKSFFDAISQEMVFPLHIRIGYSQREEYNSFTQTIQGTLDRETIVNPEYRPASTGYQYQTTCLPITYFVDASKIDPRKVLPSWLLFDFVDWLNTSISTINKVEKNLKKVIEVVGYACVGSFLAMTFTKIYRKATCNINELTSIFTTIFGDKDSQGNNECLQCVAHQFNKDPKDFEGFKGFFEKIRIRQKDLSDTCLKKCAPSCSSGWQAEAKIYQAYRLTCDRLFGHETPSGWTKGFSDSELLDVRKNAKTCATDISTKGYPLLAQPCKQLIKKVPGASTAYYDEEDMCVDAQFEKDGGKIYKIISSVPGNDDLFELTAAESGAEYTTLYAVKQADRHYLTRMPKTCSQICTGKSGTSSKFSSISNMLSGQTRIEGKVTTAGRCSTTSLCKELSNIANKNDQKTSKGDPTTFNVGGTPYTLSSATPMGYTIDCFPGSKGLGNEFTAISKDPNQNYECCCLSSSTDVKIAGNYYMPSDVEPRDFSKAGIDENSNGPPYDGKEGVMIDDSDKEAIENMRWSYRYFRENWAAPKNDNIKDVEPNPDPVRDVNVKSDGKPEDKKVDDLIDLQWKSQRYKYNPDRYIKERDFSACFGQNYWGIDNSLDKKGEILKLDPAKQWGPVLYCASIGQLYNRLGVIKNIMGAMQGCLMSVRTAGGADTGVCKELFNQYVCSMIWNVISWATGGCDPLIGGGDPEEKEEKWGQKFKAGFKGVFEGIEESVSDITSEYGNVKLNNLLGVGKEGIARRICLGAFGFDWEINAHSLIDLAYTTPFATLVQPVTKSREYLTFDPNSFKSIYDYRSSWLINPGCDLDNYRVQLACVSRNEINKPGVDCSKQNDPQGIYCDCLNNDREESITWYSSRGPIRQGQLENIDYHGDRPISSQYRFDHLKFILTPSRNLLSRLRDKCFGYGHEDGVYYFPITDKTARLLSECTVDLATGIFDCSQGQGIFTGRGTAYIIKIDINGRDPRLDRDPPRLVAGKSSLDVAFTIQNRGDKKCLKIIYPGSNLPYYEIDIKGTHTYGPIPIMEIVRVGDKDVQKTISSCSPSQIKNNRGEPTPCNVLVDLDSISTGPIINQLNDNFKITFKQLDKIKVSGGERVDFDKIGDKDWKILDGDNLKNNPNIETVNVKSIERISNGIRIMTEKGSTVDIIEVKIASNELTSVTYNFNLPSAQDHDSPPQILSYALYYPKNLEEPCSATNLANEVENQYGISKTQPIVIVSESTNQCTGNKKVKAGCSCDGISCGIGTDQYCYTPRQKNPPPVPTATPSPSPTATTNPVPKMVCSSLIACEPEKILADVCACGDYACGYDSNNDYCYKLYPDSPDETYKCGNK